MQKNVGKVLRLGVVDNDGCYIDLNPFATEVDPELAVIHKEQVERLNSELIKCTGRPEGLAAAVTEDMMRYGIRIRFLICEAGNIVRDMISGYRRILVPKENMKVMSELNKILVGAAGRFNYKVQPGKQFVTTCFFDYKTCSGEAFFQTMDNFVNELISKGYFTRKDITENVKYDLTQDSVDFRPAGVDKGIAVEAVHQMYLEEGYEITGFFGIADSGNDLPFVHYIKKFPGTVILAPENATKALKPYVDILGSGRAFKGVVNATEKYCKMLGV